MIFCVVLGMGTRFSKNTANELGTPPSGPFALKPMFDRSVYGLNPK